MEFFMLNNQIALNQALSTIKHSIRYSIYSKIHIKFHNLNLFSLSNNDLN